MACAGVSSNPSARVTSQNSVNVHIHAPSVAAIAATSVHGCSRHNHAIKSSLCITVASRRCMLGRLRMTGILRRRTRQRRGASFSSQSINPEIGCLPRQMATSTATGMSSSVESNPNAIRSASLMRCCPTSTIYEPMAMNVKLASSSSVLSTEAAASATDAGTLWRVG